MWVAFVCVCSVHTMKTDPCWMIFKNGWRNMRFVFAVLMKVAGLVGAGVLTVHGVLLRLKALLVVI